MLSVRIEGDKAVIEWMKDLGDKGIPRAQDRALRRIGIGIFRIAFDYLSGAGSKKSTKKGAYAGGWPVPVRTGWLRQMLAWVPPGETKANICGSFAAGLNETIIYDSADYANSIHEGTGSSAKFGRRPFITGAFEFFSQGDQVVRITEEEIDKEIQK